MNPEKRKNPRKKPVYPTCKADEELRVLIRARQAVIYVVSWEEDRVISSLSRISDDEKINFAGMQVWDVARGLRDATGNVIESAEGITSANQILRHIQGIAEETASLSQAKKQRGPIFVLCDLARHMDPQSERRLRILSKILRGTSLSIVIISPELTLPPTLAKSMTVVDYPLPGAEHIGLLVDTALDHCVSRSRLDEETAAATPRESVVSSLLGLTHVEAEDALALSVVRHNEVRVPALLDTKRQIIRKGEVLDYIFPDTTMSGVGGLAGVKEFVRLRKAAFSEKAREYGLDLPRGVFLLGVQGAGKSLCAKAIAHELGFPLLKLDAGRLFGSLMGESESKAREALRVAESVAPCVLFIDEMDKAISGGNSVSTDSGTTKRVVATILDWMMEKTSPVFVVGAANSISGCPAAIFRKGRFDEIFFVDLPQASEREDIFRIHIRKRGRDPGDYDVRRLVAATDRFSGAEVEGAIVDAMGAAFCEDREFDTDDVLRSIANTRPLAAVAKEEVDAIRDHARERGMKKAGDPYYKRVLEDEERSRFDEI